MALVLSIENETVLPDGGPLSVTVPGRRGIDIGRDQHLDWTLPDPSRFISGKHCEIRYQDGGYWLYDVSTNGTFLNGSDRRMQGPHRLRNGDRIEIGQYLISVRLDDEDSRVAGERNAESPSNPPDNFWGDVENAAPPAPRRDFQPPRELRPVNPDPLVWAFDAPSAARPDNARRENPPEPPLRAPIPDSEDMAWARGAPPPPPPVEAAQPLPQPRRPAGVADSVASWVEPPPQPPPAADGGSPGPSFQPRPAAASARPAPDVGFRAGPQAGEFSEPPRATGLTGPEVIQRFARGAGLPEDGLAWKDPGELAEELGVLMRLVAFELKQLLQARSEAKRVTRSAAQTTVQALDNNPLKFSPTAEDALRIMFARPSSGYLDARRTLEQSFRDLKSHQVKTYSAMQHAMRMLLEDLDPQTISESVDSSGLAKLVGSRKARLWDAYVARWEAKAGVHEDGMRDAFLRYFAECYERGGR